MSSKVAKKEQEVVTFPKWFRIALWVLRSFGELKWLKALKNFLLELVVQASEILVIMALVLSMVNFLTGGHLMQSLPWLSDMWAWLQGIAIDAGFGVVLVNFLDNFRKETRVQCFVYFVLTVLLAFNAGAVTYIDSLASAAHLPMTDPGVNPFPLWVLSLTRAIAVVGFLGVSRIHSYDFTKIPVPSLFSIVKDATALVATPETQITTIEEAKQITAANVEEIKKVREESDAKVTEIRAEQKDESDSKDQDDAETTTFTMPEFTKKEKKGVVRKVVEVKDDGDSDIAQRIVTAIAEMKSENIKITDGAIAKRLDVSRHTVFRNKPRS